MHTMVEVDNLTAAEQELIRAAVGNQGLLEVVNRIECRGRAIVAGKRKFFDPSDRSVADDYLALLPRLQAMALIQLAADKKGYELTNVGWQFSRKLGR
jgi:hypothetical protein